MRWQFWRRRRPASDASARFANGQLILAGHLTFETVMDLEREARTHLPETRAVDLKAVIFMDSAGVALLVEWKRRAERSHRQLDFLNLPDQAKSIARLSNALVILGGG